MTMSTKKVMSIVVLITAATIFALSSVVVKPAIAQTFGGGADGGAGSSSTGSSSTGSSSTGSSSTGSSSTGSSSGKYQEFKSCLSDAEKNGDVTEQQIRDCFSPIYNPNGSSGTTSTTDYGNSNSDDYNDDDMEDNKQK